MNNTKLELLDSCINGDREKYDALVGEMFDHFSCFFSLLKENGISDLPNPITFEKNSEVAEFNLSTQISLESTGGSVDVFNCKITAKPSSKQTTKVEIRK